MATAPWVTTRPAPPRKKLTLAQRARRAELKRIKYRTDPAYRLRYINRERAKHGVEPLATLTDSAKLRIPMETNDG